MFTLEFSSAYMSSIFTVSHLNQSVRQVLEVEIGQIWLSAEISNFSQPSSGHWYFTLKDDHAQVRCAMFRNCNRRSVVKPQNGQQVLVRASITVYEPRGEYQLIIESMQSAGEGVLQHKFEQLKQRLITEGIFDQNHKRRLPSPVKQVGVITSVSGAVLHDVLQILQRRDPSLPVVIYPTAVQGTDAPLQIVRAIEIANQRAECDLLILSRGGGSLEDLSSFNDERVARAIFNSHIVIVSAVGHETDVTIADFVADLRAPTPSAAAELVSRNQLELIRQLQVQRQHIEVAMDYYLAQCHQRFTTLNHHLQQQHPQLRLAHQQNLLTKLQNRLENGVARQILLPLQRMDRLQQRLAQLPLPRIIHGYQQQIQRQSYRLKQALQHQLHCYRQRFGIACSQLEAVSPLATLSRGYNVTQTPAGTVLKTTQQVQTGDKLITCLQDGWVESEVTQINTTQKMRRNKLFFL